MKIKRSNLIQMLHEIDQENSAEVLLETIVYFCKTFPSTAWRSIFEDAEERKKLVDHYLQFRQASVDSLPACDVPKAAARLNDYFEVPSMMQCFLMAVITKLYEQITPDAQCLASLFGSENAARVHAVLGRHPILSEQMHENVLKPKRFTKDEQRKIGYLKKAVHYLEVATSTSSNVIPKEIFETTQVLKGNLETIYDM